MKMLITAGTAVALCAACSEAPTRTWIYEGDEAASVVNANFCSGLTESKLESPSVQRDAETGVWTIEYPAFTAGCGAYKFTGVYDFEDSAEGGEPTYTYKVDVCNRCEAPKIWNYLVESNYASRNLGEGMPQGRDVPDKPEMLAREKLGPDGRPIVKHGAAERPSSTELDCPGSIMWPEYEPIAQFEVDPDVRTAQTLPVAFEPAAQKFLNVADAESSVTTILWPKLYPQNADITGLQAASHLDHCASQTDTSAEYVSGEAYRPYNAPYDPQEKYFRQRTEFPELPDEFLLDLELHAGR
jgi:hypothetical protein